jgi:hypothetical protein
MYSHRVGLEYHICHADEEIPLLVYTSQPNPLETQETPIRSPCYGVTVDAIKASSKIVIKYNLAVTPHFL